MMPCWRGASSDSCDRTPNVRSHKMLSTQCIAPTAFAGFAMRAPMNIKMQAEAEVVAPPPPPTLTPHPHPHPHTHLTLTLTLTPPPPSPLPSPSPSPSPFTLTPHPHPHPHHPYHHHPLHMGICILTMTTTMNWVVASGMAHLAQSTIPLMNATHTPAWGAPSRGVRHPPT